MNTSVSTSVNIKFYGEEETVWKYSAGDILKSNGVPLQSITLGVLIQVFYMDKWKEPKPYIEALF